jgi:hypothetical protein
MLFRKLDQGAGSALYKKRTLKYNSGAGLSVDGSNSTDSRYQSVPGMLGFMVSTPCDARNTLGTELMVEANVCSKYAGKHCVSVIWAENGCADVVLRCMKRCE